MPQEEHSFLYTVGPNLSPISRHNHVTLSVCAGLQGRRLENAAWRIQGMRANGHSPLPEASIDELLESASINIPRPAGMPKSSSFATLKTLEKGVQSHQTDQAADELLELCIKHKWKNESLQDVMDFVKASPKHQVRRPTSANQLRFQPHNLRPLCAVFTHSMERNGEPDSPSVTTSMWTVPI